MLPVHLYDGRDPRKGLPDSLPGEEPTQGGRGVAGTSEGGWCTNLQNRPRLCTQLLSHPCISFPHGRWKIIFKCLSDEIIPPFLKFSN